MELPLNPSPHVLTCVGNAQTTVRVAQICFNFKKAILRHKTFKVLARLSFKEKLNVLLLPKQLNAELQIKPIKNH